LQSIYPFKMSGVVGDQGVTTHDAECGNQNIGIIN
jgi:hypothetical protein